MTEAPAAGTPSAAGSATLPAVPGRRPVRMALPVVALVLLAGLWGGLGRLGWSPPGLRPSMAAMHGTVMVLGLFGTLISAERAVAMRRRWAFAGPVATLLGAVWLLLGGPIEVGQALLLAGALVATAVTALVWRLQPALHNLGLLAGTLAWTGGAALWLAGVPIHEVTPWLAAFLALTIAAERLELARMAALTPVARRAFVALVAALWAGLLLGLAAPDAGARVFAVSLAGLALWLAVRDVARRTLRLPGLPRFIAGCLLLGYAWLGVGGVLWAVVGDTPAGPLRDAALHAFFLGFVMSMVFAHAPVIAPSVLGIAVPYRRWFVGHVALLNAGLAVRVAGGVGGWWELVRWGGVLNVAAVLAFVAATAASALLGRTQRV